jgi:hypothetical protein
MTLCRLLLEKKREKRRNAQEVLAALSFLEVEERTGRASLDVTEFRYIVARFCELARLDPDEVWQEPHSMMPLSWAQQTSTQPLHVYCGCICACSLSNFCLSAFSGRVLHFCKAIAPLAWLHQCRCILWVLCILIPLLCRSLMA